MGTGVVITGGTGEENEVQRGWGGGFVISINTALLNDYSSNLLGLYDGFRHWGRGSVSGLQRIGDKLRTSWKS